MLLMSGVGVDRGRCAVLCCGVLCDVEVRERRRERERAPIRVQVRVPVTVLTAYTSYKW